MNVTLRFVYNLDDDLFSGTGEVVRIEKTLEVSDDNTSDDEEKTLSLSNENLLEEHAEETDNDEDSEMRMYAEMLPPLVLIETHQDRKMKSMFPFIMINF